MTVKLTLHHQDEGYPWPKLWADLAATLGARVEGEVRASHCMLMSDAPAAAIRGALAGRWPEVRLMGIGESIEIYKEKGRPEAVAGRFRLAELGGSHAIGHTRMATESAVTTEHSHPFLTGLDLCLVHNGSLSNHNRLRLGLQRHGIRFQTDNDTEVAAGYLTWRLAEGASLDQALEAALDDLDGFYTFAVGTRDGFAVLRDRFACKPAVLAETDDWVAMASEYRSIAHLPGAETARIGSRRRRPSTAGRGTDRCSRSTCRRPRSASSTGPCTRCLPTPASAAGASSTRAARMRSRSA